MPKDWDNHKAEIERLYMVEQLPLKDVRNILRTQHAFDASIRSYRMKLDEWRMWKNNSKTERRKTKTISRRRQPRAVSVSESLEEASSTSALPPPVDISGSTDFDSFHGISIPRGSLDIAELLPMLSGFRDRPERGLELMLFKWTPDGSYLKAAMNYLQENKATFRIDFDTTPGASIFRYIDESVASQEKYPLAKMCLTVDFEQFRQKDDEYQYLTYPPDWIRQWRRACASQTWIDVQECLGCLRYYRFTLGSYFLPTARNFLAEQLLLKNMQTLEQPRDRHGLISLFEQVDQAKVCRQESMDILDYFKDAPNGGRDLDPIWYKRFFQFHGPDDTENWAYVREYRQKFSQLKILHDSAGCADQLVPNLLSAANVLKESKVILDTVQCEDVPPTNEDPSQHPSTPIVVQGSQRPRNILRMLLDDMYESWAVEHDIRKMVACLLGHVFSLSISYPLSPEESVFILISQTIPANNQVRFTLDVLKAISNSWGQTPTKGSMHDWDTWVAVRDSFTLAGLKETVAKKLHLPFEITLSLDDRIHTTVPVVKLILDAFAGLVGEQVLLSLKAHIKQNHALGLPYTLPLHEYKSILDTLHRRKIKVNQDLFAFLGRVFVWESIDKNGDEDKEGRRFFESSDDE